MEREELAQEGSNSDDGSDASDNNDDIEIERVEQDDTVGHQFLWGYRGESPDLPRDTFEEEKVCKIQTIFLVSLFGYFSLMTYITYLNN